MLENTLKDQLTGDSANITQPIELVASLDDGAKSQELLDLLQDIASLSDKITVIRRDDGVPNRPLRSIGRDGHRRPLCRPSDGARVQFAGSRPVEGRGHPSKTAQEVIAQIKDLEGDYRFETYFSLSCQNCPDVVQALNLMSALNPKIAMWPSTAPYSRRRSRRAKSWRCRRSFSMESLSAKAG